MRARLAALGAATAAFVAIATLTPTAASAATRPTLNLGSKGAAVRTLQRRLIAEHYDPGTVDGNYGAQTEEAVWAFETVNRLPQTSRFGPRSWNALARPKSPRVVAPRGARTRVEVNLTTQLLVLYERGKVALISHVSSGGGYKFCETGDGCDNYAVTPTGNFKVYWKDSGWSTSPLGQLYDANYFYKGYAIHGEGYVPDKPVSHGCVRVPVHTAVILYKKLNVGMPVFVRRP
jgi:lipoprotein-anchoring transpeptidase ErfK/SrfK